MVEQIMPLSLRSLFWLFLGYAVIWGGVVFFVVNLRRRQEALARQVAELERRLGERGR